MQAEKTDSELLQQYHAEKNPAILNTLFARHIDTGFRTAMRYMRNPSDAEDVLQLAFIQFLKNLHLFRTDATTIKPWLVKMIINTCLNQLKEEKRRKNRQRQVASKRMAAFEESENNLESKSDQELLKTKIKNLVDTLPEKYRSPLWLVLYEGLTYPEVASVLALPEKTVRTQVSRGLKRLREILGSLGTILSVDAITLLMKTTVLENASEATKKLIDTQKLFQSIKSPPAHLARYTENTVKTSLISAKLILWSLFFSIMAVASFFAFQKNEKNNTNTQISTAPSQQPNDVNISWTFSKEIDRNLPVLAGSWEWSKKENAMISGKDLPIVISLPVAYQKKPFVLETTFAPLKSVEKNDGRYCFAMLWEKDKYTLENTTYFTSTKESKIIDVTKPIEAKVYFVQDCILTYMNGECIRINQYTQPLKEANPVIISQGLPFQKIIIRTLDTVSNEVQTNLQDKLNKKGVFKEKTLISNEIPLN